MQKNYAQALFEKATDVADRKSVELLIKNLVAILKSEGKLKLLPSILKEYERLSERRAAEKAHLYVANEKAVKKAPESQNVLNFTKEIGVEAKDLEVVVDASLVGGFRLESPTRLVDASHKRSLLHLYRKVISF